MPVAGASHHLWVACLGIYIGLVFIACARLTRATAREQLGALAGAVAAALVNIATDSAAHAAGLWHYVEATTPFGPLLYYIEAGLGCGALALVALWLRRRWGRRAVVGFVIAFGLYAPLRDYATEQLTGLIAFSWSPLTVVADALSSVALPLTTAYMTLVAIAPRRMPEGAAARRR
jgi:hypothetical protein